MTKTEVEIPDGTDEEKAMYRSVAKKFGLKVVEDKTPKVILGKVKVIQVETYCTLCETTSIKHIRMLKYTDKTWKNDKYITKEEADGIPETGLHKNTVPCCLNCEDFLMKKDKIDLVRMVTRSRSATLINTATKKVLEDMRKKKKEEENTN